MKLWQTLLRSSNRDTVSRYSLNQYAADLAHFQYNGSVYPHGAGSTAWSKTEDVENSFVGYCQQIYKSSGVVYAVMAARRMLFRQARFMWQDFANGTEGDYFWTPDLELLSKPWPNGTMGELLSRMDQDTSLGGNFYAVRDGDRLRRLRPDWVTIVLTAPPAEAVNSDVAGYWFHPGRVYTAAAQDGPGPSDAWYLPDEVAHWTPDPDPEASYRGMSWLTPVIREIAADKAATVHKEKFFSNGATLGTIVSARENLTTDQFRDWTRNFNEQHQGLDNAYRPLFFASPVDVTVRGLDLRQLDFKTTQGHGETRVCAAGRVPPIIVGVSEGLEAATYSNYGQARRAFGDAWAHPQWEDAAGALATLFPAPPERISRLWYTSKHVAFLREDQKDEAEIQQTQAATIASLISAGFTPESAVDAVINNDMRRLVHTGMVSVQLQPPGGGGVPETDPALAGEATPPSEEVIEGEIVAGELESGVARHMPGKHDQSSHGRRGPRAAVKAAGEKAAGRVVEATAEAVVPPNRDDRKAGRDISGNVDYKGLPVAYNAKTGENDALKAIIRQQGFAGRPRVVTSAEFDAAVHDDDAREVWRGLSTPVGSSGGSLAEQYRTGDFYVGLGINGDGTYVAMNRADGEFYGSTLLRIGLRKDAKVISAGDLDAEMDAFFAAEDGRRKSAELRALDEKLLKDLAVARTERSRANIRRKYRDEVFGLDPDRSIALQRDPGVFAALRGYDAIEIPKERSPDKHHEMIILNRTATIVQEG